MMCHTFLLRERESGGELGQIYALGGSQELWEGDLAVLHLEFRPLGFVAVA